VILSQQLWFAEAIVTKVFVDATKSFSPFSALMWGVLILIPRCIPGSDLDRCQGIASKSYASQRASQQPVNDCSCKRNMKCLLFLVSSSMTSKIQSELGQMEEATLFENANTFPKLPSHFFALQDYLLRYSARMSWPPAITPTSVLWLIIQEEGKKNDSYHCTRVKARRAKEVFIAAQEQHRAPWGSGGGGVNKGEWRRALDWVSGCYGRNIRCPLAFGNGLWILAGII